MIKIYLMNIVIIFETLVEYIINIERSDVKWRKYF